MNFQQNNTEKKEQNTNIHVRIDDDEKKKTHLPLEKYHYKQIKRKHNAIFTQFGDSSSM